MKISQNESMFDRIFRGILGVLVGIGSYVWLMGWLQIAGYVVTFVLLFTAISGFCLLYVPLKINTKK